MFVRQPLMLLFGTEASQDRVYSSELSQGHSVESIRKEQRRRLLGPKEATFVEKRQTSNILLLLYVSANPLGRYGRYRSKDSMVKAPNEAPKSPCKCA